MRKHFRHLTVAAAATLMLTISASPGLARNLSSSSSTIRVEWFPLTFNGEGLASFRCLVTMEGSYHSRTIPKSERLLIGLITRARFSRPCTRESAWAFNGTERNETLGNTSLPNSLPWHMTYERFAGVLPNMTFLAFLLLGARILIRVEIILGKVLCTYTASATNGNLGLIAHIVGGTITEMSADNIRRIRSETAGCPEGSFEGSGSFTVLESTSVITVRLI